MTYLRRILVLAVLLTVTSTAFSQPIKDPNVFRNGPKVVQAFREVVRKPSEATVRVLADGKAVAFGTIVDPDGWIITKWSEIEHQRDKITVKFKDGKVLKAEIRGVRDDDKEKAAYDLAMLKVEAKGLPTVQWGPSKEATVGRWVASIGTGMDPIGIGVVSVATRKYVPLDQPPKLDVSKSGYLGVDKLQDVPGGVKIGLITPKAPAEKAGLKADDIILEAAGRKTTGIEGLINTIGRLKPGDEVLLKLKRGEEQLEIKVKLAPRPKNLQGNPQETMGTTLSMRRGGFPAILQHDSGIHPEDCGGPLVDLDGKTVGINIARAGRTETYAIPSEDILPLLADLKSGKFAPKDEIVISKARTPDFTMTTSLNDKDKLDKKRVNLGPKRFMKVEEVTLSAGATYIIEMVSTDIDPYLILEDSKGNKLAEDDDSGSDLNAKIVFRAPADGVYHIICTTFNPSETGSFTLSVRRKVEAKEKK